MSDCEEREDSCSVQETEREKTGSHTHQGTPLLSGGTCLVISHSSTDVLSKSLTVGGKVRGHSNKPHPPSSSSAVNHTSSTGTLCSEIM